MMLLPLLLNIPIHILITLTTVILSYLWYRRSGDAIRSILPSSRQPETLAERPFGPEARHDEDEQQRVVPKRKF